MERLAKELHEEIKTETELSFTVSDVRSLLASEYEPKHGSQYGESSSSPQYMETQLTDDAVATMDGWLDEAYLHMVSDKDVIAQLDEILLLLIAVRGEACGKELLQDLRRLFGVDLSPGTVYPHLNDLADEGMLDMTELTKRKIYRIADAEATFNSVEPAVNRLITFSLVLKALIIDCKTRHVQTQRSETDER
ncbi:PadR family transcriptional regulator [Halogeometricum borinquense]|uniref:PadR family transcriptional regulator n=1 Tax=Halogeometricum borinquense TaxID=60847 RepID=A0A6C0UKB0_9EURY|nr:helix-turn-helix transcriptional regulator [Halogeometricum borinquense]QIB75677.1 PadR family transcriptional regulator [Halogeometricum borinquense]